jgi:tetratricopeptide (TPR) repeat protein
MKRWIWLFALLVACQYRSVEEASPKVEVVDQLLFQLDRGTLANDSMLYLAKRSLLLSEELGYRAGVAHSNLYLGKILYRIGNLNQSLGHLHQALQLFENEGDYPKVAEANVQLGEVYLRIENFAQAYYYLEQSISLFERMGDLSGVAHARGQLGHFYEKTAQYDSALWYQQKALNFFQQTNDSSELAAIFDNLGSIYEDLAVYELAQENFVKAYQYNLSLGELNGSLINLNNIGDVYRKKGQLDSALFFTRLVLKRSREQQNDYQVKSAARDLSKIFFESGDYDSAYHYLALGYELTEKIFSDEIAREMATAQAIFDLERKQQTIQLLEQDKAYNRKLTIAGFTGVGLLVVLIGFISYQQISKTRKERKLLVTENELSKAELINAQLNQEKLRTELENKRLRADQLQMELDLKSKSLSRSALHLIQKNEFLVSLKDNLNKIKKGDEKEINKKIRKLTKSIDRNFSLDEDWKEFESIFQQVHDTFLDQLSEKFPDLSASEVRLCAMIRINLHSNEIASVLGISQDSLRVARYRLRKKLALEKGDNLYTFLVNLG